MSVDAIARHTARARLAEHLVRSAFPPEQDGVNMAAVTALTRTLTAERRVSLTGPNKIALIMALTRAHVTDFTQSDWDGWCGAAGDAKVVTFHKHDLDYLMRVLDIAWWGECVFVVLDETGITFNGWEEQRGYAYQVRVGFDVEIWDGERESD